VKIKFIRRFIQNFDDKVEPMNALLKKYVLFKWDNISMKSFEYINEAITMAPFLVNLDYYKDFIIFSFSFEDTIVGLLMPKNKDNYE